MPWGMRRMAWCHAEKVIGYQVEAGWPLSLQSTREKGIMLTCNGPVQSLCKTLSLYIPLLHKRLFLCALQWQWQNAGLESHLVTLASPKSINWHLKFSLVENENTASLQKNWWICFSLLHNQGWPFGKICTSKHVEIYLGTPLYSTIHLYFAGLVNLLPAI